MTIAAVDITVTRATMYSLFEFEVPPANVLIE